MSTAELTVYIIDDDPSVRDALTLLLSVRGYRTAVFAGAEDFLRAWQPEWRGCLLIDIRMPGMDGLTLQARLLELGCSLPAVIITGHGDVESARQAFRARAIDFLEKPIDHDKMVAAIEQAFATESAVLARRSADARTAALLAQLTPREREVLHFIVGGYHNRDIAERMRISVRTVEVHKAHLMSKMGVDHVADLVRMTATVVRR